ncbi:MAG TPA: FAD-dependent oxidoreductase [Phycisphaerales bacterium]|nr:FAD-dependent oxidoreductase [Phycisphaerales bacterium]
MPHAGTASDPHKLVIIGSGPAGWTAAIYAARAALDPVVYIGVPRQDPSIVLPGGQLMLTTEVENYPGFPHGVTGPEMMASFQKQAERFGTKVIGEDITVCEFSRTPATKAHILHTSGGQAVHARAVIIATGAVANWIGLPNELRLARAGGGVSACAVCDGALPAFRDQHLAVVGGGDTAMEEATYLTKFASKVSVIHRREELRASKVMQQRFLSKPNAKVLWNKVVVDVIGDEKIEAVMLEDTKTKQRSRLDVRGLFVAIGHTPATKFLIPPQKVIEDVHLPMVMNWYKSIMGNAAEREAAEAKKDETALPEDWSEQYGKLAYLYAKSDTTYVKLTPKGYVNLDHRHSATNLEGVFAAGDVADAEYRQAVTAAGMGCQAALDAERWLGRVGLA